MNESTCVQLDLVTKQLDTSDLQWMQGRGSFRPFLGLAIRRWWQFFQINSKSIKFFSKLSKYIQNLLHKFSWKIQSGWADPCWWGLCLITGVSPQGPSTLVVFQWKFPFFRTKNVIFKFMAYMSYLSLKLFETSQNNMIRENSLFFTWIREKHHLWLIKIREIWAFLKQNQGKNFKLCTRHPVQIYSEKCHRATPKFKWIPYINFYIKVNYESNIDTILSQSFWVDGHKWASVGNY